MEYFGNLLWHVRLGGRPVETSGVSEPRHMWKRLQLNGIVQEERTRSELSFDKRTQRESVVQCSWLFLWIDEGGEDVGNRGLIATR
jgi:hypothetical protein